MEGPPTARPLGSSTAEGSERRQEEAGLQDRGPGQSRDFMLGQGGTPTPTCPSSRAPEPGRDGAQQTGSARHAQRWANRALAGTCASTRQLHTDKYLPTDPSRLMSAWAATR